MNAAGTEFDFEIPTRMSCRQPRYSQDGLDLDAAFPHQKEHGRIDFVEDSRIRRIDTLVACGVYIGKAVRFN